MRDKDTLSLMESYSRVYLKENEQVQSQPSQEQLAAEVEKQLQSILPQLQQKVAGLNDQQKQELLQKIEAAGDNPEELQKLLGESYLEEGIFDRLSSRASGAYSALTGGKPGDTSGKATDYQSAKINKRFEILQNTIGKDLKELQRDLATTKNSDPKIVNTVNQMVTTLGSEHGIKPVESKLGDIRHTIGRGVQSVGTALAIAAPILAASTAIGGALGLTGVGLGIAKGAVTGATTSILKDLLKGEKANLKRAAVTGAAAALTGGLAAKYFGGTTPTTSGGGHTPVDTSNINVKDNFMYNDPSAHVQPGVASIGQSDPSNIADIIKQHWIGGTDTQMGHMDTSGLANNHSPADNKMLNYLVNLAKKQGIDFSKMTSHQIDTWISNNSGAHGRL